MPERWTQVVVYRQGIPDPSYDHYEVSTHGRLRRVGGDRVLKGTTTKKGYKNIELQPKKGSKNAPMVAGIGTLVAYAFLGAPPSAYHLVAHRDTEAGNDHVTNLEYATRAQIWERNRLEVEKRKERLFASIAKRAASLALVLGSFAMIDGPSMAVDTTPSLEPTTVLACTRLGVSEDWQQLNSRPWRRVG